MSALQAAPASQTEILQRYFGMIGDLAMRPTGLPCLRGKAYADKISSIESARIILEGLMEAASAWAVYAWASASSASGAHALAGTR